MSVHFRNYEMKWHDATDGHTLSPFRVNPRLRDKLEPCLLELAMAGAVAIYTYGCINNRLIRGSTTTTSKHAEGTRSSGYTRWEDGTNGSRAIDIRKVLFHDGRSLVVTRQADRNLMINWLEERGFTVYHKKMGSVHPDHLHIEV